MTTRIFHPLVIVALGVGVLTLGWLAGMSG